MTHHRCPICNGTGLVSVPPGVAGDINSFTSSQTGPYPCRACNGTGIVWEATVQTLPDYACMCGTTSGCKLHGWNQI